MYPVFSFKGGKISGKKINPKLWRSNEREKIILENYLFLFLCISLQGQFSGDFYPHAAISRYLLGLLMVKRTELDAIQQFQKRQSQKTPILVLVGTSENTDESTSSKSRFQSADDEESSDWF